MNVDVPVIVPPRVRRVLAICAEDNAVTAQDILGKRRSKNITSARTQACQTLRRMGFTLPEIGRVLNLHHTSVYYATAKQQTAGRFAPMHRIGSPEVPVPDYSGEWAI